jgi:two-component system chemotaxis sensor kinase CheA
MDMSPYRDLFVSETREHLQTMSQLVVALEQGAADPDGIAALFRAAHSVKGMAASLELEAITALAHALEDLMDRVRKGLPFAKGVTDLLLEGIDLLHPMVDAVAGGTPALPAEELIGRIRGYDPALEGEPPLPAGQGKGVSGRKDALPGDELQTVRIRTTLLDKLVNCAGELLTIRHRLELLAADGGVPGLKETVNDLTRLVRGLRDDVTSARLLPFATISDRLPRVVRDLARKENKEVSWVATGTDVELDRAILEALADPLLHIVRNAVDHGLERADERSAFGKPPVGTVLLQVERELDRVVVSVRDDGRGMDPDRIVATALAKGMIGSGEAAEMPRHQAFLLTCRPGFSTASEVTEVSGRGVGMDAVLTAVQHLGGTLAIDAEPGAGATIALRIPATVAIINVLLVRVAHLMLAVPLTVIRRTSDLDRRTVVRRNGGLYFAWDGAELRLELLGSILGTAPTAAVQDHIPVLHCEVRGALVGFAVDEIIGHREVYSKPLGRPLEALRGFSGGAVQGDGSVVLILDPATLPIPVHPCPTGSGIPYSGCAS